MSVLFDFLEIFKIKGVDLEFHPLLIIYTQCEQWLKVSLHHTHTTVVAPVVQNNLNFETKSGRESSLNSCVSANSV